MITKQQLLDSMRHETQVIRHLAAQVRESRLDWRPTPAQRSILELLRYMTHMALVPALYCVRGDWTHAEGLAEEAQSVTHETFGAAMERQLVRIEEALDGLDEDAAATKPAAMPWGAPTTQGAGLMDMVLKTYVAYRMQLFLYAKQSGCADLGPFDCWAGAPPE